MLTRRIWLLAGTVVLIGLAPALTYAGDLTFAVKMDLEERYVWRGIEFDDGWSLQPDLALGWEVTDQVTLRLESWWNLAVEGPETDKELLFETDTTLQASRRVNDLVELYAGYVNYRNPKSDVDGEGEFNTDELFVGLTMSNDLAWFDMGTFYDIDKVRGWYLNLAAGMTIPAADSLSIDPAVHVGIASDQSYDPDRPDDLAYYLDDGFVDASASLGLVYTFSEHFSAGATLNYALRLDHWGAHTGLDDDYMWVGLSVGFDL